MKHGEIRVLIGRNKTPLIPWRFKTLKLLYKLLTYYFFIIDLGPHEKLALALRQGLRDCVGWVSRTTVVVLLTGGCAESGYAHTHRSVSSHLIQYVPHNDFAVTMDLT